MSSSLRPLRWRAAVLIAGAVFVLAWLYLAGAGGAYLLQVDFSWSGSFLEGAEVLAGDSVIGTLRAQPGGQRVTGFELDPGEYEIRVRTEECEGIPKRVALLKGESRRAVVMAEIEDGSTCRVRLW